MTMRCLAVRHIACEGLGTFEAPLRARFDEVGYLDMDESANLPEALEDAAHADLVISLGGPMSVWKANLSSFLKREIRLLRKRIMQGKPTLGICLGSQLMAAAMGGRVFRGPQPEIGWYPVRFTSEMTIHRVLKLLVEDSDLFFHWHGDTFELPSGSRLIGSSHLFKKQGFMIGRHALALQFHAEIDPPSLEAWLAAYGASLTPGTGVNTPEEMRAGILAHGESLRQRGQAFLNRWLDELWP